MIRAAAKNHEDVAVLVDAGDYARAARRAGAAWRHDDTGAAPAARRQGVRAHRRLRRGHRQLVRSRAWRGCAGLSRLRRPAHRKASLRREPASDRRRSTAHRMCASASPPRGRCRASSFPTTTSTTPTRPMNASPSSIRRAPRPAPSSSTPIRAASPKGPSLHRRLSQGSRLRPGFGVRRHRRAQSHARRRRGARHHRNFHRGDHRARRERRGHCHRRREEEFAASPCRRPARSARRRPDGKDSRRRALGAIARQCRGRRHGAETGDQARADQCRVARSALCFPRRQAREIEHDRLRQGFRNGRHRRRTDEPRRFGAHRRPQGRSMLRRRPDVRSPRPRVRWSPPMRSFRSPTGFWSPSKPALPR